MLKLQRRRLQSWTRSHKKRNELLTKEIVISDITLIEKTGGKSTIFRRSAGRQDL